ncbi:signal transduction histidine kinase [Microbacterium halimionae]|uniref:Signal transduction histidine kinase n=1 Tax=Microbacterium halimionae TaxID=1526413 RepID=A0A7W3JPR7_9MICO|nr:ATP-binding protein [Microbacterium halimionae]MBA8816709.1 signal transduction histidine kinase [Microbacterium halimionae]NII94995.1 signal transduction histidine kinase [Microbacterium halimionae]
MSTAVPISRPPLRRPRECLISGTCEGLAAHLGWSVAWTRMLFVALALVSGAGILLYVWIWAFTRWDETMSASPSRKAPVAWIFASVAAVGLLALVVWALTWSSRGVVFADTSNWNLFLVATAAFAVAAGLWATFIDGADTARGPKHVLSVRLTVTAILAVLFLIEGALLRQGGLYAFTGALVALAGVVLVYSSVFIEKIRQLSGERVKRIREEQRSEMAAHLHDSVLQTLALIQNRAGASSEAARLARAQERELRAWLYDGDAPADSDLPTDLRDYAAALELDFAVRIDVVSTGASAERASGELAAAAREAMLNAARHAGGEVSVYIEGTSDYVEVFVRDRGPGFDLEAVPDDRLGVRQSILGRIRRIGGTATVRPGSGGVGVDVHLRLMNNVNTSAEAAS